MKAVKRASVKANPPIIAAARTEIFHYEQRSSDWFQAHIGVPSASRFATIMAKGKDGGESETRRTLMRAMAGEIITGQPAESFCSDAMRRGIEMEPEAIEYYENERGVDVMSVGFITRTIPREFGPELIAGASPDGLIGFDGAVEVKTLKPELIVAAIDGGIVKAPSEHKAQLQGTLWVSDREWIDLIMFYRKMRPVPIIRVYRDEAYIRQISEAVEVFAYDLRKLLERIEAASASAKGLK